MSNKLALIGSFVFPEKIGSFLSKIEKKYNVTPKGVFCYEILDNEFYFMTFLSNQKIDLRRLSINSLILHKRGECFYTINGLNKIIELDYGLEPGNIDYISYSIDWDKYQNKLILSKDGSLKIYTLNRIFSIN